MLKNFNVAVDTVKELRNKQFIVNTNDLNTIKLSITILSDGEPYDLTGTAVRLAVKKPDKLSVFQDCTITDATAGKCEVVLATQAYIVPGVHFAEVMVYLDGSSKVAVSGRFAYTASRGLLDDESVESTNELQSITQALADIETVVQDLRDNGTGIDAQARSDIQTLTTDMAQKAEQIYVDGGLANKRDKVTLIDDADITQNLRNMITGTTPVNNATPATGSVTEVTLDAIQKYRMLQGNKYPFSAYSTVDRDTDVKYAKLLTAIVDAKIYGKVDMDKSYFLKTFARNHASMNYRIDIHDSDDKKVCGGDSAFEVTENANGFTTVIIPPYNNSGITCEIIIDYTKVDDGAVYYGVVDCTPERYTFDKQCLLNDYLVKRDSNILSLNEQTFKAFERFSAGDINANEYELAKIYSAIQFLEIIGSDQTKPHKLRAISRNYGNIGDSVNRWGWRFIIARKDGSSWVDILDTGKEFEIVEQNGVTEVSYNNGTVKATMRVNYSLLPDNYAKTLDVADPLFSIKKECIVSSSTVESLTIPKKNLVVFNFTNKVLDIYSKYGSNSDIKFTFEKFSVNQLFAFHLINKNVNTESEPQEFTGGTVINADLTDWIGPYYVQAVNNGDGGTKARTGGCHGSNGDAETGFATGITDKIEVICDGKRLVTDETVKCDKVDVYVKNRIMAYNTKSVSRYVLEEKVHYHIEGSKVDVKVEIRPLEDIIIEDYYGQQAVNRYYDGIYYIQGQHDDIVATLNTASDSGQKQDYFVSQAVLSKSGTNETMLMSMDNTRGLGTRELLPLTSPCIRCTDVEKTYMWLIYNNSTPFDTNEIKYWIGSYEFRNVD
ncbi:BppU family phage baseplate upper protein [Bacillus marasmi]|uniref:BppU family phage baseplate upper protein n=1 Tax=Bacillus marasmi TaxID=1926279 RepID=UPI0011C9821F|nr:BppU family phage baseplate upper protein [Bacillus marasmi]